MKLRKLIKLEEVVEEVLIVDELARVDDCYLIFRVIQILEPELAASTFENVMFNAKSKGLSFESITRARRKVQRKYPGLVEKETQGARNIEQLEYMEFNNENHIPGVI